MRYIGKRDLMAKAKIMQATSYWPDINGMH
jgi:hypothetical protein